jgi:hypothetical protein
MLIWMFNLFKALSPFGGAARLNAGKCPAKKEINA